VPQPAPPSSAFARSGVKHAPGRWQSDPRELPWMLSWPARVSLGPIGWRPAAAAEGQADAKLTDQSRLAVAGCHRTAALSRFAASRIEPVPRSLRNCHWPCPPCPPATTRTREALALFGLLPPGWSRSYDPVGVSCGLCRCCGRWHVRCGLFMPVGAFLAFRLRV